MQEEGNVKTPKEIAKEFMDTYNHMDMDGLFSLFADDCILICPESRWLAPKRTLEWMQGKEGLRSILNYDKTMCPDRQMLVAREAIEGHLIFQEAFWWGTVTGPMKVGDEVFTGGGNVVQSWQVQIFEIKNGKIAKMIVYYDLLPGLLQSGVQIEEWVKGKENGWNVMFGAS